MWCVPEMVVLNFPEGIEILVSNVYGCDTNMEKLSDLGYELSLSSQFWMKSVVAWVFALLLKIDFRSHIYKSR